MHQTVLLFSLRIRDGEVAFSKLIFSFSHKNPMFNVIKKKKKLDKVDYENCDCYILFVVTVDAFY